MVLPNLIPASPWWQLLNWIFAPLTFQRRCQQCYGDIFTVRLGQIGHGVFLAHPEMIQKVFSQSNKFDSGRGNTLAESMVGSNSLMLLDGDRHRRERKLLMPPFHKERILTYAQQICQITEQALEQWQIGQRFIARSAMQEISLAVILRVVFGLQGGQRYQRLRLLLTNWLDMVESPLRSSVLFLKFLQQDWGPWGQMQQRQAEVHGLLQAEIETRRAKVIPNQEDVLSLMLMARDEQGQGMADEEIRDELISMLFAGYETTATMLAWVLYQTHRHPPVLDKLRQELQHLGPSLDPMAIAQLPYLSAVCQETLRMYPVIPILFPRILKTPFQLAGYQLEPETVLYPSAYLVHYREELYPQPHQFQPERFLQKQYTASEYMPFGGGNRRCLGFALAELELKLVLATILVNYELSLAESKPIQPQRRGFTLAPTGGVPLVPQAHLGS